MHTDAYNLETPRIDKALHALESEFSTNFIPHSLLKEAVAKTDVRVSKRSTMYNETVWMYNMCCMWSSHMVFSRFHRSSKLH